MRMLEHGALVLTGRDFVSLTAGTNSLAKPQCEGIESPRDCSRGESGEAAGMESRRDHYHACQYLSEPVLRKAEAFEVLLVRCKATLTYILRVLWVAKTPLYRKCPIHGHSLTS